MNTSIHHSEEICKRLEAKKLTETISAYAMEYIMAIMLAIFSTGYHGKTVDMEKHSDKHRTSISRFLHNDQWDASPLEKAMKELVIRTIYEEAGGSRTQLIFLKIFAFLSSHLLRFARPPILSIVSVTVIISRTFDFIIICLFCSSMSFRLSHIDTLLFLLLYFGDGIVSSFIILYQNKKFIFPYNYTDYGAGLYSSGSIFSRCRVFDYF